MNPGQIIMLVIGFIIWAGALAAVSIYFLAKDVPILIAPLMIIFIILTAVVLILPSWLHRKEKK